MKVLRSIFTVLFSIIVCMLLIALPYIYAFNSSVISSKSLADSIIDSGISKDIKEMIDNNIDTSIELVEENIKKETGKDLDDQRVAEVKEEVTDTLKSFNKEENIDKLIRGLIEVSLDQKDFQVNTLIKDNIDNVIKENNLKISKDTQNQINDFIDEVTTDLNKELTSSFDGILEVNSNNAIVNPIPKYTNIIKSIKTGIIIAIAVLIVCIVAMNYNNLKSASYSLMTCFVVAGVLTLTGTMIVSSFKNLLFGTSTDSLSSLVNNIVSNIISKANTLSISYLIIAALIIIGLVVSKQIAKRKNNHEIANNSL